MRSPAVGAARVGEPGPGVGGVGSVGGGRLEGHVLIESVQTMWVNGFPRVDGFIGLAGAHIA